jgi:hypothetical protein
MKKEIDIKKHFWKVIWHAIVITIAFIEASLTNSNKYAEEFIGGILALLIYAPFLLVTTIKVWERYSQEKRNALLFFTSLPIIELVVLVMEGK